ncbi:MAG: TPM domain-containing protein [Patescibacteria group bacterium]
MNFIPTAFAAADLPARPLGPAGEDWYVLDSADVLSDETEAALQTQLSTLASETSTGMVVVTIPTLNDYPIESYALELGREWGVGQEGLDNGLVFLVVTEDREMRIEVGYGLEGAITDSNSYLILTHTATPYLKEDNYDQGVLESMAQLETLARGETFDLPEATAQQDYSDLLSTLFFWGLPLLWAVVSWFSSTKAWWLGGIFGGAFGLVVGGVTGLLMGGIGGLALDFIVSKFFFQKVGNPGIFFGGGRGGHGGSGGGGFSGFGGGGFGGGGASGRF